MTLPRRRMKHTSPETEILERSILLNIFAQRLKECRKNAKLRQQDVSEALGIGYSTYCRYEQGGRMPCIDDAAKMAQLFHVSLDITYGAD